jgi:hypothetical protein
MDSSAPADILYSIPTLNPTQPGRRYPLIITPNSIVRLRPSNHGLAVTTEEGLNVSQIIHENSRGVTYIVSLGSPNNFIQ